ncbi:GTP-binding protein [Pisolithus orientalis]|uniref:GTP-binding protein n=1 Tax=Pisolithus orientalis TaxID=936130 RepID=UPI0022244908|nr:GTP-binding protein [Pisolithus orientalis]KAI5990057.1 GTP-binding protein [Pisolithus orientalis]
MAPSSVRSWWRSLRRSQRPSDNAVNPTQALNYRLDPTEAKRQIDRIPRFRILVMGRANAGKTTVLQRVCNTTDQPEIFDGTGEKVDTRAVQGSLGRGYHNIEDELVFKSNPRYVFHDSCGFEAGSEAEFDKMKKFVTDQAKSTKLENRLHAIWYCIPLNESHRMVMAAERKFFNECDSGHVPVIVLLTKADTLNLDAVQQLMRRGLTVDDAMKEAPGVEKQLQQGCLEKIKGWLNELKFPPQSFLILTGMEQESADCEELLKCTANALTEEGLQGLLISSQQSNLGLCMEFAIMKTLKRSMNEGADHFDLGELPYALGSWFPFEVCEILQVPV